MSIKIEKVVTDKFEMRYFKFGTGSKTAVILPGLSLTSVMNSADSVVSAYKDMKEDYTVYLFDRRTDCPKGYNIKDMGDDTAEAFKALGLKDIYLFGVSQGGMIAQIIALDYPGLINKLALCSTISRITDENTKVLKEWLSYAENGDENSLVRRMVETVFSDAFVNKYGKLLAELMGGAGEEDMKRFIILAESFDGFDVSERLGEIRFPVLVIGSKADKIFPFKDIALTAEKAEAKMLVYDNFGHAVYDETPDCLEKVLRFYNGDVNF
jgi:pimeloyl-ACP methyl ester carboxylesterase